MNPSPHDTTSNHIKIQNVNPKNHNKTLKMNVTTVKCSLANKMITTCHVRHIFMLVNKTIKNNLSHATIC